MERGKLYRLLFLILKEKANQKKKNDDGYIKRWRDRITERFFNRRYDQLSDEELFFLIKSISKEAKKPSELRATQSELQLLKFYLIKVGIYYCPLDDVEIVVEGEGAYKGEQLRQYLMKRFAIGNLPSSAVKILYERWINPKVNQFLAEGGYRKMGRPWLFFYENLTSREVKYLINRFRKIANNLNYAKFENIFFTN